MSEFVWQYMPNKRGVDVYGLVHDGVAVAEPNSFSSELFYDQVDISYTQVGYNQPVVIQQYAPFTEYERLHNEVSLTGGAAVKINIPKDNELAFIPAPGVYYEQYRYGARGFVAYDVSLSNVMNSGHVLHVSEYLHQKSGIISIDPNVSISLPPSVSVEVKYQKQYSSPIRTEMKVSYTVTYS